MSLVHVVLFTVISTYTTHRHLWQRYLTYTYLHRTDAYTEGHEIVRSVNRQHVNHVASVNASMKTAWNMKKKVWYTHIQNPLHANKRQNVAFFHFLRRIVFNTVTMRKVNTKCRNMPRLSINSNSAFKNLCTPCYTTRPLINMTRTINSYLQSFWKSLFTTLSEKLPSRFTSKPTSTQPQAQKQLPSSDQFVQQPWVPINPNYRSKFPQILNIYSAHN